MYQTASSPYCIHIAGPSPLLLLRVMVDQEGVLFVSSCKVLLASAKAKLYKSSVYRYKFDFYTFDWITPLQPDILGLLGSSWVGIPLASCKFMPRYVQDRVPH